jgi:hypothetical protein
MKRHQVEQDLADLEPLLAWLRAKETALNPQTADPLPQTA